MSEDDHNDHDDHEDREDQDDLETTMRHGLQELANDAPRGEGLWETTTSMIAIHVDPDEDVPPTAPAAKPPAATPTVATPQAQAPPAPPLAPPPSPAAPGPDRRGLWIGIAIGVLIGILVAIIVVLLLTRDSGGSATPAPASNSSATARPQAVKRFAAGPIPAHDFVFNDVAEARIVVADASWQELGVLTPGVGETWQAVQLAPDRVHLFVARADGPCGGLWDFDLQHRKLRAVFDNADAVALSPDATTAVVGWSTGCASSAGKKAGTAAVRDLATLRDVELPEVGGGEVNAAWSPDGQRAAVKLAGPHDAHVYDRNGGHLAALARPRSGQDAVAWTQAGLMFVDLGFDGTAVVREYDPISDAPIAEVGRVPQVGEGKGLVTPEVRGIHEVAGRTYVDIEGDADGRTYAQLRVIQHGTAPVVADDWRGNRLVG